MDTKYALAGVSNAVAIAEQLHGVKAIATNAKAQSLLASLQLQLADLKARVAGLVEAKPSPARKSRKSKTQGSELVYEDGLYQILFDAT